MEFSEVIAARRSIRKFKPKEISEETVKDLIEAARLAPSGSNLQPARFIVARSPQAKESIGKCTPYKFVVKAAVIFVCCADLTTITTRETRVGELFREGAFDGVEMDMSDPSAVTPIMDDDMIKAYLSMNTAIAIEHIALKSVDLGLGSCWIGRFDREKLQKLLNLNDNIYPVILLPVGLPDQSPEARPRLALDKYLLQTI
jgi:nitroreductase